MDWVLVLPSLGLALYGALFLWAPRLMRTQQFALIHLLLGFLYLLLLPLPAAVAHKFPDPGATVISAFGTYFFATMTTLMVLQAGANLVQDGAASAAGDSIFAVLSHPIELFLNVQKAIWLLCLAVASGEQAPLWGPLFFLCSLTGVYYLLLLIKVFSRWNIFPRLRPSLIFSNLEMFLVAALLLAFSLS